MTKRDDPWMGVSVCIGLLQVLLQPSPLVQDLLLTIWHIVKLGGERNDVRGTDVVAPEKVIFLITAFGVHRKSVVVMGKVSKASKKITSFSIA